MREGGECMSSISGIHGSSYTFYGKFASGKKVQNAADGASELAIIEKENAQIRGMQAGANNMSSAKDVLNISDGALGRVTDYLQRMRELALGVANTAIMGPSEVQAIQQEIDQLKQGIADIASQTQYNGMNILNGDQSQYQLAVDANGNSTGFLAGNATLQALGIADFDVTKEFDLDAIDEAIAKVSSQRSSMGAKSNALDHALRYNSGAVYNLTSAKSKLEDLDYPKAISEQKKKETLQTYAIMMQKRQQQDAARQASMFWTH